MRENRKLNHIAEAFLFFLVFVFVVSRISVFAKTSSKGKVMPIKKKGLSIKRYEGYTSINMKGTMNYKLCREKAKVAKDGSCVVNGRVLVAMGQKYGKAGDCFDITLKDKVTGSKHVLQVMMGDEKDDRDTHNGEGWYRDDAGGSHIVEGIVDVSRISAKARIMGDLDYNGPRWNGVVVKIVKVSGDLSGNFEEDIEEKKDTEGEPIWTDDTTNSYAVQELADNYMNIIYGENYKEEKTAGKTLGTDIVSRGNGKLGIPLKIKSFKMLSEGGSVSSRFGPRSSQGGRISSYHRGLDLCDRMGAPIYAAESGTVTIARYYGAYGNCVVIKHRGELSNIKTYYGHMSKIIAKQGQKVEKGQKIGLEGSTGQSTGPHLHFAVELSGKFVDPLPYLQKSN